MVVSMFEMCDMQEGRKCNFTWQLGASTKIWSFVNPPKFENLQIIEH